MDYLEAFAQWLLEDGKRPKTIESYRNDVKQFQLYLRADAVDENAPLTRYSFVQYKQFLLDGNYKVSTINKKVNSLKVYNDYLQLKGIVDGNYIQLRKDRVPVASGSDRSVNRCRSGSCTRLYRRCR